MINFNTTGLSPEILASVFATESIKDFSNTTATTPDLSRMIGNFTTETVGKMNALLNNYKAPVVQSGFASRELQENMYLESLNNGYQKFAQECVASTKRYNSLPNEIQSMLNPLRNMKVAVETKLQGMTEGSNPTMKFALDFKHKQIVNAMESVIFGICANLADREMSTSPLNIATESYNYQQAIPYPKLEVPVQWVNAASTSYPKLAKVKSLLNYFTSIPVHFQEIWYVKKNENNVKVAEVKREDLLNYMDPSKVPGLDGFFSTQTRSLTLVKDNFNKVLDLRVARIYHPENEVLTKTDGTQVKATGDFKKDPYQDGQERTADQCIEFLTGNEYVRSDIAITGVVINDDLIATAKKDVYDFASGKVLSEAINELDQKGKMIPWVADAKKPDEIYFLSVYFDGQAHTLTVAVNKSKTSMPDIEAIRFEFKMNDLFNQYKPDIVTEIRTRRTMINAGSLVRDDIPNLQEHFSIIDARQGGSILAKLTNLTAERQAHGKEMTWFEGFMEMSERLKAEYVANDFKQNSTLLYAEGYANLDLKGEVNKDQSYRYELGMTLASLKSKLNTQANSTADVQMNMLTHNQHLPVLDSYLTIVTGTVNEETNGEFLGVKQESRTNILTLGKDNSTPIMSVVVGTDKMDLAANPYVDGDHTRGYKNPGEVEYKFHIVPYYKESNLETSLLVETPTQIKADGQLRSARHVTVPNIQIEYSAKFQELRSAAGTLTVKGASVHLI